MAFNSKYYKDGHMYEHRPKDTRAFTTFLTPDNVVIGIFQGARGANPHLDVRVKLLADGIEKTPLLLPHTYWVVDLMLKSINYSKEVKEIMAYYLKFYDTCKPFNKINERVDYKLQTLEYIKGKYQHLEHQKTNTLSLEFIVIIIELFSLNEKQTNGAYMFRNLLKKIYDYADGKTGYIDLLEAAKPGFR